MLPSQVKKVFNIFEHLLLSLFFSFSLVFFLYHLIFAHRIIPGIAVFGVGSLSGLSQTEALAKVSNQVSHLQEKEINFDFNDTKTTLTAQGLGIEFDPVETVRQAYNVGRSGDLAADLLIEIKTLIRSTPLNFSYTLNDDLWLSKSSGLYKNLSLQEAVFVYDGDLRIQVEKAGVDISLEEFQKRLLTSLARLDNKVPLPFPRLYPKITAKNLQAIAPQIKTLLLSRPVMINNLEKTIIPENDYLKMLDFSTSSPSANLSSVTSFVKSLSGRFNRPSRSLSFEVKDNKVTQFYPGQEGLEVDQDSLLQTLSREIVLGRQIKVEIPFKRVEARVSRNDFGIKELLGFGHSTFTGSIPGRIKNIKRASLALNGILVAPGETFSFDEAVGEISEQTGYDYAYIIKEGRTVLGTGGGVCQVSTTIFRAALNAGLPIIKRVAHAYRVHFYEEGGSPVGLDATVYPPTVDFQFKNDTPAHILVASEVEEDSLNFRIYGTNDGRVAKLVGPTILSQTPAPSPLYQDDPTLTKGQIKQVDFAAGGANVIFEREVWRGGGLLFKDRFVSNYQPWQAVYLVGTKT